MRAGLPALARDPIDLPIRNRDFLIMAAATIVAVCTIVSAVGIFAGLEARF